MKESDRLNQELERLNKISEDHNSGKRKLHSHAIQGLNRKMTDIAWRRNLALRSEKQQAGDKQFRNRVSGESEEYLRWWRKRGRFNPDV